MKQITNDLVLIDNFNESELMRRCQNELIISPICPDYLFEEKVVGDKRERVHDFSGMGEGAGIVYKKLIREAKPFFANLADKKVNYSHVLLVADVEVEDKVILKKLRLSKPEFLGRCRITVDEINRDLQKQGLFQSKCLTMSEFFAEQNYDFVGKIESLYDQLLESKDMRLNVFIKLVQQKRVDLYQFWFGLSKEVGMNRAVHEMGMYASFGYCPKINDGVIFCADSEILSQCYNLFKKIKTPVIYIQGNY